MDFSGLVVSFLFGAIGMVVFVYGKRQARFLLMLDGLALMIYPYFVSNWILSLAIGTLLTAGALAIGWFGIGR